jgi:lipopolysaccharide/colanic/teichoic acid biosynthesis glycosyltransferase
MSTRELTDKTETENRRPREGRPDLMYGFNEAAIDVGPRFGRSHARTRSRPLAERINSALIRGMDIAVSSVLLLVLLPLIVVAAIAVRLDSPGPAFFRTTRMGYRGRPLRMLKFRKMHHDASGPSLTMDDDNRFTRIGALYAKLKVDEIPQLWHVLKGEMSLVGPRPETEEFVTLHAEDYDRILSVRPGITGLSQIAFAEESRILDDDDPLQHYVSRILPQKVGLDCMYAEKRSLWFNLRILFWTTSAVLMRKAVAVNRRTGRMNLRRR